MPISLTDVWFVLLPGSGRRSGGAFGFGASVKTVEAIMAVESGGTLPSPDTLPTRQAAGSIRAWPSGGVDTRARLDRLNAVRAPPERPECTSGRPAHSIHTHPLSTYPSDNFLLYFENNVST